MKGQPSAAAGSAETWSWKPTLLIVLGLAIATLAVYWPVGRHEFINYDDTDYVTANAFVQAGFTRTGIAWAFGNLAGERTYWHPLTWLSHMLDCQLFGLKAGAHHWVNLLFHLANTLLLFAVLRRMTGTEGPSAVVAALFALHPLQVDTVAWIAERKNLLSTFFGLWTLWAYARYAQGRRMKTESRAAFPAVGYYVLAFMFFAFSLMSKPALVTLPFVLLLLDYWPLNRLQLKTIVSLLLEKVPFLALSGLSSVATVLAHQRLNSLASVGALPLADRMGNALVSYSRYLGKVFWPSHLAVFYPHPHGWPPGEVLASVALLVIVSALCIGVCRSYPCLLTGWLWFLGTLVPVIGLIQAGEQSMADRFVYLPLVGLLIPLAFGLNQLTQRLRWGTPLLGALAGLACAGCLVTTHFQLGHWRNSETLFRHAIAVTQGNYSAYLSLGTDLQAQGKLEEAIACYSEALRFKPSHASAHNNLGTALAAQGKLDEAIPHFQAAVRIRPEYSDAFNNLGVLLTQQGKPAEAVAPLTRAVQLKPTYAEAHYNLANALAALKKQREALAEYEIALRLKPRHSLAHYKIAGLLLAEGDTAAALDHYQAALVGNPRYAEAHYQLATLLVSRGEVEAGLQHYREALRLKPKWVEALNNLAWLLATHPNAKYRDGPEALRLASRVAELTGNKDAEALDTLAAAYAETGDFTNAVATLTRGLALAATNQPGNLTTQMQTHLRLCQSHRPVRE
jgi:protein O-mannosyl-transferase